MDCEACKTQEHERATWPHTRSAGIDGMVRVSKVPFGAWICEECYERGEREAIEEIAATAWCVTDFNKGEKR